MDFDNPFFRLTPTPCIVMLPDAPRFTIKSVNQAVLDSTNTRESDLIGKGIFEAFPENPADKSSNSAKNLIDSISYVISTREPHRMEAQKYDIPIRGTEKFETRYWVAENIPVLDCSGEVIYIMSTGKDITDSILANSKKDEALHLYQDLFQLSPIPFFVYELGSLRFLDANKASLNQYGYSREEFLKMTIKDIRPKKELKVIEDIIKEYRDHQRMYFPAIKHQRKNGEVFLVDVYSNYVMFEGKHAKIIIANDVSAQQLYIETVEKQNRKLREIAWMQSHIVRAPLARAMGCMDLLRKDTLNDPRKEQLIEYMLTSVKEFDGIIEKIVHQSQQVTLQ